MRREDLEQLKPPYDDPEPDRARFSNRIGVSLQAVRALHATVFADLDATVYGIGWWRDALPPQARILLADYLVEAISSIETNMIEARLHWLEARHAWEQHDAFRARSLRLGPGNRISVKMAAVEGPLDELPDHLQRLHVAGVFRAVGSAFDCLAASAAIVVAHPTSPVDKLTFPTFQNTLLQKKPPLNPEAEAFRLRLEEVVRQAGPDGWLGWTLGYRHMLVHRARRTELVTLEPESHLVDVQGRPILRSNVRRSLAREPEMSQIESMARMPSLPPVLTEDAHSTLEGVLRSAQFLIEGAAKALVGTWERRRAAPNALPQPSSQWDASRVARPGSFVGYEPGTVSFDPKVFSMAPAAVHRLAAAALSDGSSVWPR